ncbi:hypothetical protein BGZ79_004623 [Entomortierella chlamydospora]|nr:hypothetical protein BGZ79_004623 [Entomortierella chlamydospora]
MYRDLDSNDCMEFEKLLSKSESSAATFVQMIVSGSKDISLTRAKLLELKKFLFIMMYRCESRRNQYFLEIFDIITRRSIEKHMRFNNIHNIHEVWFENLKWIIKTPFDGIMDEIKRASPNGNIFAGSPLDIVSSYNGPIHIVELLDFNLLIMHYVCIWQAPEGSEFILTDNCFGCYEGPMGITLHFIYVISPQYAVVLANRSFMSSVPYDEITEMSLFKDHGLHVDPSCVYVKKCPRSHEDYTPEDVFKYRRIVIPKQKVWLVNGVFLDAAHKSVTYKSDASMYRSLLFYDKNKKKVRWIGRDYSRLKRKLFAEMNRTHSN